MRISSIQCPNSALPPHAHSIHTHSAYSKSQINPISSRYCSLADAVQCRTMCVLPQLNRAHHRHHPLRTAPTTTYLKDSGTKTNNLISLQTACARTSVWTARSPCARPQRWHRGHGRQHRARPGCCDALAHNSNWSFCVLWMQTSTAMSTQCVPGRLTL